MTDESICVDCGFNGDYHDDDGKCMNVWARAEIRNRKEWDAINKTAEDAVNEN